VALRRRAQRSGDASWQLGDAPARAARMVDLPVMLDLVSDGRYGSARQMIVGTLWRIGKPPVVLPALVSPIADPTVALHSM
jgi:hypothetical protein